jgi:hypothetical protein
MEYKSECRACAHKHSDYVCNWQVQRSGRIKLKPVYSDGLWGISAALHRHGKNDQGQEDISKQHIDIYRDEVFEYEQEVECGCRVYIPKDNLEFLEWKYESK